MSTVTITGTETTLTNFHGTGNLLFVIFAAKDVVLESGRVVLAGSPIFGGLQGIGSQFYADAVATVDESGKVTIPDIVAEPTETSSDPTVTLRAFLLDPDTKQVVQPFLYSFRIPVSPASTNWKTLMQHMTIPQLIIDPATTRTDGVIQEFDTTHGLIDSIMRHVGANIELTGGLLVSGNIAAAILSASGAINGASGTVAGDWNVGDDLNVTDDGYFGGDVHATHFYGDISTATGLPSDTMVGNTWTGLASLGIDYDSDASGAGEFSIARGGVTKFLLNNAGFATFSGGLQGALVDSGGERFNVKASPFNAKGDGVTDDTAAINAAIAAATAVKGGIVYFPPGVYLTTGEHELTRGITIEGSGGAFPGLFNLIDSSVCTIELTAPDVPLFKIGEYTTSIAIRNLSARTEETGAPFLLMKGLIGSSFGHIFERLWTVGFRAGIEVQPEDPEIQWQCDRWTARNCAFVGGPYAIYLNSQNADQVLISNCQLGAGAEQYGFYAEKCGTVTIDTCYSAGAGDTTPPLSRAMFFFTPFRDNVTIRNCWAEPHDYLIEFEDNAGGNLGVPVLIEGCSIPRIYLGHSVNITSIGNAYLDANSVTPGVSGGQDSIITSIGDTTIDNTDPTNPLAGSPFAAGTGIHTELNSLRTFIDARLSGGLRVRGKVGIGEAVPSTASLLRMELTAGERSSGVNYIEMLSGDSHDYKISRDDLTGRLLFRGTQTGGVVGYNFNGHLEPSADNQFVCGHATARWSLVRAVTVTQGDSVFTDRETGEPLYVVNEDAEGLYFNLAEVVDGETRAGARLGWFDRSGNWHVNGKIIEHG